MPVKTSRSATRLRPGYLNLRSTTGSNGSIRSHNPSLTKGFAIDTVYDDSIPKPLFVRHSKGVLAAERTLSATEPPFGEAAVAELDVLDSSEAGGRIIRGGALRVGTYVLMMALSVVSAAVLLRHLGVVRFGQYTTVISLVAVVSTVTDAGMSVIGVREFSVRQGAERDELMRDLLGRRMTLTAGGGVLVGGFARAAG
jgi:hypothetical protein